MVSGTPDPDLPNAIDVSSVTLGGELGGTIGSATVDATHSGSAHHDQDHKTRHQPGGADAMAVDAAAATGSLRTIGTGATQAAAGNHTHSASGIIVQEGDSDVDTAATTLDFDASDFNVTSSPAGEANIALAYGTSAGTPAEGNHTHVGGGAVVIPIFVQPFLVGGSGTLHGGQTPTVGSVIGTTTLDGTAYMVFSVPTGFNSLSKAVVRVYDPTTTGDLRYSVATAWGADGEDRSGTTDSISGTTVALTSGQIKDIDISAAFTGIAAGDLVGVNFTRLGSEAADTMGNLFVVVGLLIEYT